ncbi:MAG: CBS domain-containing protein [Desulfobulbaceae bacterium]|nr:CBS domain-containing protein [Desulfobulbaceae bacterium]
MGLNDEIEKAINWEIQSIDVNDSMRTAAEKMIAVKSMALVVKDGDEVIGVLTDKDLMFCFEENVDLDATVVTSCMTPCELITTKKTKSPCVQLDSAQSVKNAIALMNVSGVHHLLISGLDDKHIGLVSSLDLLKIAIK